MKKYNVVFSFSYQVEAESAEDAEQQAYDLAEEEVPRLDEMNCYSEVKMKKYNVKIIQTVPMECNTTIEAESEEKATELTRESFYSDKFINDFWPCIYNDGLVFNVEEIK